MNGYIDAHTHITTENLDLEAYFKEVERNKAAGVVKALLVLTDQEEWEKAQTISDPYFDLAYGLGPDDKQDPDEDALAALEVVLKAGRLKALGEIGLDYHWYKDNKANQQAMFIKQLALAKKYDLPVIIHAREAVADTYKILKEHDVPRKGMLHCYSGSGEMAKEFIKLGYYISLGGPLTFKNNRKGKEVIKQIDLNYLLCETDAPYLTPEPKRGTVNNSANVRYVYAFIADYLNIPLENLKETLANNYQRLFGSAR